MREVCIVITCDGCGLQFGEDDIYAVTLTVQNGKQYESDLCGECFQS